MNFACFDHLAKPLRKLRDKPELVGLRRVQSIGTSKPACAVSQLSARADHIPRRPHVNSGRQTARRIRRRHAFGKLEVSMRAAGRRSHDWRGCNVIASFDKAISSFNAIWRARFAVTINDKQPCSFATDGRQRSGMLFPLAANDMLWIVADLKPRTVRGRLSGAQGNVDRPAAEQRSATSMLQVEK